MPSTQSDGAQSAVADHFKDMIFLPIEDIRRGRNQRSQPCTKGLCEDKAKAKLKFEKVLESTDKKLNDIKSYVAEHRELSHLFYPVPQREGITGIAANFILHVNELMIGKTRLRKVPHSPPARAAAA